MGNHSNHQDHGHQHKDEASHGHHHHIVPFHMLVKVALALVVFTFLTVAAHQMHLGAFAAPVAFLIATVKACLVMLFFMGLKYDGNVNRAIFGAGFFFLTLLFFFCAVDIATRVKEISTLL